LLVGFAGVFGQHQSKRAGDIGRRKRRA
jgi:hypothetical protein